jgi:hypothetical protein
LVKWMDTGGEDKELLLPVVEGCEGCGR